LAAKLTDVGHLDWYLHLAASLPEHTIARAFREAMPAESQVRAIRFKQIINGTDSP